MNALIDHMTRRSTMLYLSISASLFDEVGLRVRPALAIYTVMKTY